MKNELKVMVIVEFGFAAFQYIYYGTPTEFILDWNDKKIPMFFNESHVWINSKIKEMSVFIIKDYIKEWRRADIRIWNNMFDLSEYNFSPITGLKSGKETDWIIK
jgi:hypothetical protein